MGLTKVFGEKPVPKILDFFIINQFWDVSIRDIAEDTGLSYRTLQTVLPLLVKQKLIGYTRTEGKAKMYQLLKDDPFVKKLKEISLEADLRAAERARIRVPVAARTR